MFIKAASKPGLTMHMVMPALRRVKQEDLELEASLDQ